MLRSLSALSACALLLVALAGCGGGGGEKAASQTAVLKFTAIPDQNTTLLQERFAPMAAHLSQVLACRWSTCPRATTRPRWRCSATATCTWPGSAA